jgi:hypothetical protein
MKIAIRPRFFFQGENERDRCSDPESKQAIEEQ